MAAAIQSRLEPGTQAGLFKGLLSRVGMAREAVTAQVFELMKAYPSPRIWDTIGATVAFKLINQLRLERCRIRSFTPEYAALVRTHNAGDATRDKTHIIYVFNCVIYRNSNSSKILPSFERRRASFGGSIRLCS